MVFPFDELRDTKELSFFHGRSYGFLPANDQGPNLTLCAIMMGSKSPGHHPSFLACACMQPNGFIKVTAFSQGLNFSRNVNEHAFNATPC
jgi:hypothetical protein